MSQRNLDQEDPSPPVVTSTSTGNDDAQSTGSNDDATPRDTGQIEAPKTLFHLGSQGTGEACFNNPGAVALTPRGYDV